MAGTTLSYPEDFTTEFEGCRAKDDLVQHLVDTCAGNARGYFSTSGDALAMVDFAGHVKVYRQESRQTAPN